jgi:hypothetical protein
MANSKISALTSATAPLAGTETLPIVQSGSTVKVAVSDLTAGRAVSAASLALTTTPLPVTSGGTGTATAFTSGSAIFAGASGVYSQNNTRYFWDNTNFYLGIANNTPDQPITIDASSGFGIGLRQSIYRHLIDARGNTLDIRADTGGTSGDVRIFANGAVERLRIGATGDTTALTGNFIPSTAAKGVNFTANTPVAGMTSQLLNWYEEGTWTPNQGAGLTVVGAFSSTGRYTRIGRQVSISGTVTGATSVAVTAAGVITSNLPFTVVTAGHGDATNVAINASATVICTGTSVTSAAAIAATATITFSATYFV